MYSWYCTYLIPSEEQTDDLSLSLPFYVLYSTPKDVQSSVLYIHSYCISTYIWKIDGKKKYHTYDKSSCLLSSFPPSYMYLFHLLLIIMDFFFFVSILFFYFFYFFIIIFFKINFRNNTFFFFFLHVAII